MDTTVRWISRGRLQAPILSFDSPRHLPVNKRPIRAVYFISLPALFVVEYRDDTYLVPVNTMFLIELILLIVVFGIMVLMIGFKSGK